MLDPIWHDWQWNPPPKGVRIVCERHSPEYQRFIINDVRNVAGPFNVGGLTWRPATPDDKEAPDAKS